MRQGPGAGFSGLALAAALAAASPAAAASAAPEEPLVLACKTVPVVSWSDLVIRASAVRQFIRIEKDGNLQLVTLEHSSFAWGDKQLRARILEHTIEASSLDREGAGGIQLKLDRITADISIKVGGHGSSLTFTGSCKKTDPGAMVKAISNRF